MSTIFNYIQYAVKYWYIPLIIGILSVAVGFYIFTVPVETYLTLSILFSISFIISGISEIVFSVQNQKAIYGWGWYLISGILTLGLGIYLLAYPQISITILPFVVGFTLLFKSAYLLGYAFDLKSYGLKWGNLALVSVIGFVLSILLIVNPEITSFSLSILTGLTFVFVGISYIMLSLNLKKLKNAQQKIKTELREKIQQLEAQLKYELGK